MPAQAARRHTAPLLTEPSREVGSRPFGRLWRLRHNTAEMGLRRQPNESPACTRCSQLSGSTRAVYLPYVALSRGALLSKLLK
jgi:hypothetical protein